MQDFIRGGRKPQRDLLKHRTLTELRVYVQVKCIWIGKRMHSKSMYDDIDLLPVHVLHTYIHTYLHTYIPSYIHTFIHTYIHTYEYIHTCENQHEVPRAQQVRDATTRRHRLLKRSHPRRMYVRLCTYSCSGRYVCMYEHVCMKDRGCISWKKCMRRLFLCLCLFAPLWEERGNFV